MPPRHFQPNAFVREDVPLSRDNFTYLGIEEGAQTRLVLAWSPTADLPNLWMLAVRMLDRIVGSRNVPDYRLAVDPDHSFAFILCPDEAAAERLRARYGSVGDIKFFFDLVRSVRYMSFHDELNHHPRVCWLV